MVNNYARNVIALKQLKGIGNNSILKMPKDKLINYEMAEELKELVGSADGLTKAIGTAEKIIKDSKSQGIEIISDIDSRYPSYLLKIKDHPLVIFAKGDIKLLSEENLIAIVGSRTALQESLNFTKEITEKFINQKFVIVSGLAQGIDTQAHKTAVENKGKTIAVLPSDLINIYPAKNKQLAQEILDTGGLLLSEYPINSQMGKFCFVERDRIQSGLSLGVFVIESKIDGGTMQTANFCQKQERLLIVLNQDKDIPNFSGNQELIIKMKDNQNIVDYKIHLEIPDYVTANKLREPTTITYSVADSQIQEILQRINYIKIKLQEIGESKKEKTSDQKTLF